MRNPASSNSWPAPESWSPTVSCHEIRNLCGAIAVVHANLGRNLSFAENEDYRALGTLVEGLEKISSMELRQSATESMHGVDLASVLDELRIVIEPALRDSAIAVEWRIPAALPQVWAEGQVYCSRYS